MVERVTIADGPSEWYTEYTMVRDRNEECKDTNV